MKSILLKLLLKWYIKENREVIQLTSGEDYNLFKFKNSEDVIRLLKSYMTSSTLWHFKAKTDEERSIIKGAALLAQVLVDGHRAVYSIEETMGLSDEKKYKHWEKFKVKLDILKKIE